MLQAKLLKL